MKGVMSRGKKGTIRAGHACSHPRVPRAPQAGSSRKFLAGVGLSGSVRCHGPGIALLTNGGMQQQQKSVLVYHRA
ncbi:hypothetical protein TNCV_2145401 [Trichonephila clavipes]|uniref:Uncharacterized protein n=1 Tax=Trichonephila clavipes TaxID=2585209 RepID=A0A8X6STQ9_TRICX|nr:hypothetical protein TNCV_2145401 [Trichonephila clavipes]